MLRISGLRRTVAALRWTIVCGVVVVAVVGIASAEFVRTTFASSADEPSLEPMPSGPESGDAQPVVDAEASKFFEEKIRPLLVDRCQKCHGEEKQKGGLRLDSAAHIATGGDAGPVVVAGNPAESLLISAIRYEDSGLQMPPDRKLDDAEIADLTRWVQQGAVWPGHSAEVRVAKPTGFQVTEQDRQYWAFRPIQRPTPPPVANPETVSNPIDQFIVAKLEARGISPNGLASPRQLIRRVSFDLTGLPPTPEEVAEFEADHSPAAYDRLLDRLLASPHYGERWGRYWLDVVRFAQSNGYERDSEKPYAWKYRDYVISAFNADKPFDQFVCEQLAGDQLDTVTPESLTATGYYRLGTWDDEPADKRQAIFDELDDVVATSSQAFIGLTIGCARCHDHKFDPISQRDYYKMLAFVHPMKPYEHPREEPDSAIFAAIGDQAAIAAWQARRDELRAAVSAATDDAAKSQKQRELDEFVHQQPKPFDLTLAARDMDGHKPVTHILLRGNSGSPGDAVQAGFPQVLLPAAASETSDGNDTSDSSDTRAANDTSAGTSSPPASRRALAEWITNPHNPLTARVFANRIWQHHFGRGIVPTSNDFGKTGLPPTHPELLDWLASELISGGWHVKRMHKLIMQSQTYRRSSSTANSSGIHGDEANTGYWRQNLQRLNAEALRDNILAVSGTLDRSLGGRGVFPRLDREVIGGQSRPGADWEVQPPSASQRRSVYLFIKRTLLVPMLEAFDYNITSQPVGERATTTVAPQALIFLNSDFMQHQAHAFARRLESLPAADVPSRVAAAYQIALGRNPEPKEMETAVQFIERQSNRLQTVVQPISFRPAVPVSLSSGYLDALPVSEFLAGPYEPQGVTETSAAALEQWTFVRGLWGNDYSGIRTLDIRQGPAAFFKPSLIQNGTVTAELQLGPASEVVSLLFRCQVTGELYRGYEFAIEPAEGRILLRRFSGNRPGGSPEDKERDEPFTLASAVRYVAPGELLPVRVELAGSDIKVFIAKETEPALSATDPRPLLEPGMVGLRTWGSELQCRQLLVNADAGTPLRIDPSVPLSREQADHSALMSLCLLVLNLNEFAYVD